MIVFLTIMTTEWKRGSRDSCNFLSVTLPLFALQTTDQRTEPIAPDELLEHPHIKEAFQADASLNLIHATSPKLELALHHVTTSIEWADALARKAGLPSPTGIVASSSKKKFILLSTEHASDNSADEKSQQRYFGLLTEPEASPEQISDYITSLH